MNAQKMMTDVMEQAIDSWDVALKNGVRIQEETARWWSEVMSEAGSAQDWQKRVQNAMSEAIPAAQKNAEDGLRLMDQSCRSGLDLFKRAVEATQAENLGQAQAKAQELWEASLAAMRANAQAVVQANARIVDAWTQVARKNMNGNGNGKHAE
jgi:hypothetical protein